MRDAARRIRDSGVASVSVSSVFSPLTSECEDAAWEILDAEAPHVRVTLSHTLGPRIGLLERENASLLNAALVGPGPRTSSRRSRARSGRPASTAPSWSP